MTVQLERFTIAGPAGQLTGLATPAGADDAAPPVLLLHGINMSSAVWRRLVDELGPGRRYIAPDLRGHGGSGQQGPFTADDYADDALAVLDELGVERVHVVGTSFGGMVACTLAARVPERVASIAAIGSALAIEGVDLEQATAALQGMGVRPFYDMFLPQASFAPGTDQSLIDEAAATASEGRDAELVIDVSVTAFTSDVTAAAEKVRCPALVMAGELDLTCPTPLGEAMAKVLSTELVRVPGSGHMVIVEDAPATAALLQPHLSSAS